MQCSLKSILGYVIRAMDGEFGTTADFLLDREHWSVRYGVLDTGTWFPGRRVLVSPLSLGEPDWSDQSMPVSLSREAIEQGPTLEEGGRLLRSFRELRGYEVLDQAGVAGTLADLVTDTRSWAITGLVVERGGFFDSQQVLVAPDWTGHLSVPGRILRLEMTRSQLEACPEYDARDPIEAVRSIPHRGHEGQPRG